MDQLMDILTEVNADVDFETCDIEITPVDIVPENFNSAEAMWEMIQRLQDN